MKKRILASALGIVLVISMAATRVISYATEGEADTSGLSVETPKVEVSYNTATQTDLQESVVDVDNDIHEEVESQIPTEWEEISISNTEQFLEFARNCNLDIWSYNKKVVLTNDISLVGSNFQGISTFGGFFDGQGHTISDVNIREENSYTGLFCRIQKEGVIKDLNVSGTIMPSGSPIHVGGICADNSGTILNCRFKGVIYGNDYVGCIAAMNDLTGIISDCRSEGFVMGNHFVGGIAGANTGNIMNCINEALINTTITDSQMSIDAMSNITKVIELIKNGQNRTESASTDTTASDVGGICGQSMGIIYRCLNNSDVGYEHVGYNIGGIAGRQSGYILSCSNNGNIFGRKDVGGIVGQAEPYITVDLSADIAYQLTQAISKLHDIITVTLKDAKAQSNVITNRLSVIQQFTKGAIEDVRFIADGTIDYANNISSATNSAFSRVDYVLDEMSKNGGFMDQMTDAAKNTRESADHLKATVKDLDIEQYMSEEDKALYKASEERIETATSTYTTLMENGSIAYINKYISKAIIDGTYEASDMIYISEGTDITSTFTSPANLGLSDLPADADSVVNAYNKNGDWYHSTDNADFPILDDNDSRNVGDTNLVADAAGYAEPLATAYADNTYLAQSGGVTYLGEVADASAQLTGIITKNLDKMEQATRSDALKTVNSIENATDNIYNAGSEAKRIVSNVANSEDIRFPQLNADYKAHTSSLANNLQGVNDNFGLLNNEVNNATGVLVDDLQAMADQFNSIMLLYTDAIDGVLEMDYTSNYEDVSLKEAATTMDATIDSCLNYGKVNGDISVSGIAGTMAIDYDFDKEGDITGIKDSKLNSSYITKCVLRNNKNYGEITGEKSNVGGICGLQEMGTVLNCGNYANATSVSGENVGGVAGSSLSYIVSSFSRGILKGSSYVGGITGNGMHIRDCFSLVNIEDSKNWYGAIAGHVDEKGEVRNNFFVSDTLAGIDRVSYTEKAEPVSYEKAISENIFLSNVAEEQSENNSKAENKKGDKKETEEVKEEAVKRIPTDFDRLTITYVLKDDDLKDGQEIVKKTTYNYGQKIVSDEYPDIKEKEGFYVTWDKDEITSLTTDETVTASYTRYLTTITDGVDGAVEDRYQSDILVDGRFKEGDALTVSRSYHDLDTETLKERIKNDKLSQDIVTIEVDIPDDGSSVHQIRFKPQQELYSFAEDNYVVYQVIGDKKVPINETGKMGKYRTYEIEGNHFILTMGLEGVHAPIVSLIILAAIGLLVLISIIVLTIIITKRHARKLPKMVKKIKEDVSEKIESKEQIFYNEEDENKAITDQKTEDENLPKKE